MILSRTGARSTTARVAVLLALTLTGISLTLPAETASATTGPQLTATPSTNLNDQNLMQVSLTGADAYNGQSLYFAECNQARATADGSYNFACSQIHGVAVSSGAVDTSQVALSGPLYQQAGAPTCTPANNGECVVAALYYNGNGYSALATTPISFATPTATATPTTNLNDGDGIQVTVSGVPSGEQIMIAECSSGASAFTKANAACANGVYGVTTATGLVTTINVVYGALGGTANRCDENTPAGHCALVVTDQGRATAIATFPLTFATPSKTVTVTPTTSLKDGQTVTVTGSGIPAEEAPFYVAECNTVYAAAHSGYPQNLAPCLSFTPPTNANGAFSTMLQIVDGPLGTTSGPVCTYATNGDCAIVLLQMGGPPDFAYTVTHTTPITFRPPVTGPPTISVSPTTYLTKTTKVTLTATNISDVDAQGDEAIEFMQCNTASAAAKGYQDGYNCNSMNDGTLADNAITTKTTLLEGYIGESKRCDAMNGCEIGLFRFPGDSADPVLISNLVPIWFETGAETKPATPSPDISGSVRSGETVTCAMNVPAHESAAYGWYVGSTKVGSGKTFSIPGSLHGQNLDCAAVLVNAAGASTPGFSNASKVGLGAPVKEKGTIYVQTSSGFNVGDKVKAAGGQWTPTPKSFSYQWYAGKKKIAGATGSHYKIGQVASGKVLWCRVTAHAPGFADGVAKTRRQQIS